jgi:ketosteroid isomerase-like protein
MSANKELIEQLYASFGKGDIPAVLESVDDSVQWSVPLTLPQGGEFKGKDGVLEFFQGLGGKWDPLSVEVEAVNDLGKDTVVGVVHGTGSLAGGGPAEYGAAHVFTVRDGKITRFREYADLDGPLAK